MKIFQKISSIFLLDKLKMQISYENDDELSEYDRKYLESLKTQNPFGVLAMFLGGASFLFGPIYAFLPILTIILCILTYGTFNKEKEDNPWTFFIGFCLALIGFYMKIHGLEHHWVV